MPEILYLMKHEMLLMAMLAILLILFIAGDRENGFWIKTVNGMMIVNCIVGWFGNGSGVLFGQMFIQNELLVFEKNILNAGTLIIFLSSSDWLRRQKHLAEFFLLLLTALLGMFLMISSGNFLMFWLSLEMTAIPVAALCNFNHDERRSSEAAMKMIFSSAFSSCILLLGISFIYGAAGTLNFSGFLLNETSGIQHVVAAGPLLLTGFILFFAGLVFKLSVVPFHFWTADVYEGSPVPVTSFLSVISKGAMVFVFASLIYKVFRPMEEQFYLLLAVLSILTMIVGNLFAIRQQNLKRFLAFSSITQVGFILIGISGNPDDGMASSIYFIVIYIFSNLAAFAVVAQVGEKTGKETIDQYRGLVRTNPGLAWTMAIALFSLAGIPPTAGFFGKLFLLTSGAAKGNYVLITIAALNMMVALYYYLRVIRAMFMDENEQAIQKLDSGFMYKTAMVICISGILITGFAGQFYSFIYSLVKIF